MVLPTSFKTSQVSAIPNHLWIIQSMKINVLNTALLQAKNSNLLQLLCCNYLSLNILGVLVTDFSPDKLFYAQHRDTTPGSVMPSFPTSSLENRLFLVWTNSWKTEKSAPSEAQLGYTKPIISSFLSCAFENHSVLRHMVCYRSHDNITAVTCGCNK